MTADAAIQLYRDTKAARLEQWVTATAVHHTWQDERRKPIGGYQSGGFRILPIEPLEA